jgi:transposase
MHWELPPQTLLTGRNDEAKSGESIGSKFIVDGSYSGEPFAQAVRDMCGAEVEVVKRNELHRFAVLPKRWVRERSFGWLDKARRRWKNCERKLHNSPQMVILAFIAVLIMRY